MAKSYTDRSIGLIVKKAFTPEKTEVKPNDDLIAQTVSGDKGRWRINHDNGDYVAIVDWADIKQWEADGYVVFDLERTVG